jgi:hypothetical protein
MPFPAFFAGPAVAARLSPGYNQQVLPNEVPFTTLVSNLSAWRPRKGDFMLYPNTDRLLRNCHLPIDNIFISIA